MITANTVTPKTVNDCVMGNQEAKGTLDDLVSGKIPFPAFGKCGILLHGLWGTGKTTLAKLLPDAIERARVGHDAQYGDFHSCAMGANGVTLMNKIVQTVMLVSCNDSNLHYVVLDEVDNLTGAALQSLKAVMNYPDVVFIMTTNHIEKIEPGIINRSYLIEMNAAQSSDWLPIVKRAIAACGALPPPDSALLPVIDSCKGSARDIVSSAVRIANEISRNQRTSDVTSGALNDSL